MYSLPLSPSFVLSLFCFQRDGVKLVTLGRGTGGRLASHKRQYDHLCFLLSKLEKTLARLGDERDCLRPTAAVRRADLDESTRVLLKEGIPEVKRKIAKELLLMKSIVTKLHENTARYLIGMVGKGGLIILPILDTAVLSKHAGHRLAEELMGLCHGEFRVTLKRRCQNAGVNLCLYHERYTTKCCGNCQHMNSHIGKAKVWRCSKCEVVHERDGNAARNIHLLYHQEFYEHHFGDKAVPAGAGAAGGGAGAPRPPKKPPKTKPPKKKPAASAGKKRGRGGAAVGRASGDGEASGGDASTDGGDDTSNSGEPARKGGRVRRPSAKAAAGGDYYNTASLFDGERTPTSELGGSHQGLGSLPDS